MLQSVANSSGHATSDTAALQMLSFSFHGVHMMWCNEKLSWCQRGVLH